MPRVILSSPAKVSLITDWMYQNGYTTGDLAEKAGVSALTVQRVFKGDAITPRTMKKIADAIDVSPLDLRKEV